MGKVDGDGDGLDEEDGSDVLMMDGTSTKKDDHEGAEINGADDKGHDTDVDIDHDVHEHDDDDVDDGDNDNNRAMVTMIMAITVLTMMTLTIMGTMLMVTALAM